MRIKTIIFTVLITLFTIILVQNTAIITFHLFFWSFSTSIILLLIIMVFIGYLFGFFTREIFRRKKKKANEQKPDTPVQQPQA